MDLKSNTGSFNHVLQMTVKLYSVGVYAWRVPGLVKLWETSPKRMHHHGPPGPSAATPLSTTAWRLWLSQRHYPHPGHLSTSITISKARMTFQSLLLSLFSSLKIHRYNLITRRDLFKKCWAKASKIAQPFLSSSRTQVWSPTSKW